VLISDDVDAIMSKYFKLHSQDLISGSATQLFFFANVIAKIQIKTSLVARSSIDVIATADFSMTI